MEDQQFNPPDDGLRVRDTQLGQGLVRPIPGLGDRTYQALRQILGLLNLRGSAHHRLRPGRGAFPERRPQLGPLNQIVPQRPDLLPSEFSQSGDRNAPGRVGHPLGGGSARRTRPEGPHLQTAGLYLKERHPPGTAGLVKSLDIPGQPGPVPFQIAVQGLFGRGWYLGDGGQGSFQLLGHLPPPHRAAVQIHHKFIQAHLRQPFGDRINGRSLLGHEQHLLAPSHHGGDEVGNGLALAGSRGTFQDEGSPTQRRVDGPVLGGVGIKHQELVGWRYSVGPGGIDVARVAAAQGLQGPLVTRQGGDQVVLHQNVQIVFDVVDHGEFLVHEVPQHQPPRVQFEVGHASDPTTQIRKDLLYLLVVQPGVGQLGSQQFLTGDLHIEFSGKMLKQCFVDHPLPIQRQFEVRLGGAGSGEACGTQQNRGSGCGFRGGRGPGGKTLGQKEGMDPQFLKVFHRFAVDGPRPSDRILDGVIRLGMLHPVDGKQFAQTNLGAGLAGEQFAKRPRSSRTQIHGSCLEVPVVDQTVAAGRVNQCGAPLLGGFLNPLPAIHTPSCLGNQTCWSDIIWARSDTSTKNGGQVGRPGMGDAVKRTTRHGPAAKNPPAIEVGGRLPREWITFHPGGGVSSMGTWQAAERLAASTIAWACRAFSRVISGAAPRLIERMK